MRIFQWHWLSEELCSHCQDKWKILLDLTEVLGETPSPIPLENSISYTSGDSLIISLP